ncbi:MAG TPA: hypothetical protein PLE19_10425 [Planctomycetota bacterium]|nr:hypothetical protein [Planctomycetota bacterium]
MKKLLASLVVLAALAVGGWFAASYLGFAWLPGTEGPAARVLPRAEWEPYGYQVREGPRARAYNLPVVVTLAPEGEATVRVLLDLQDPQNYYFAELTRSRVRLCKVESGLESELGVARPCRLAVGANKVILKRRYDTLEVVLNDVVAAAAEDESFHGGSIGAGARGPGATLKVGTPQPCDPIYFADDFMKGATEGDGWKPVAGSWNLATLRNPSLSSNAFYYVGSASGGKPAAAVRGEWFWDNYRFRAAACSAGPGDVGLYFYYRDADNCYLFRWNAARQPDGSAGRRQLLKRWHGEETVLAQAPGGYQPGVWYELETEVTGARIRTFIDGHEVFSVTDGALCFGQVGLHTAVQAPAEAHFDDTLVQSVRGFEDDFSVPALGRWRPLGGSWEPRSEEGRHACVATADAPAKAVAGSSRWRDYTLEAGVRLPQQMVPATEVGVVSRYLDETNYALFAWQPAAGAVRFEATVDGKRVAQEHAIAHKATAGTRHVLSVEWRGAVATAHLDGQPVASAWVPGLPRGAVGLYAAEAQQPRFEAVRVRFPLPPEPVLTTHEIFSRELTMEVWAGAANDWEPVSEALDGVPSEVYWHRADFFGDATMEIDLKGEAARAAAEGKQPRAVRLVLSADSPKTALSGYSFVLTWPDAAKGETAYRALLTRNGAEAAQRTVAFEAPVRRLRFERLGNYIMASVNDEPLLAAKDPQPLPGCRAAFAAHNLPIPRQDVVVFSDTVKVYTFSRASSDWRPAAGTWEISNRWECDPRWSFFSGVPDASSLAAIWNKNAFDGDVSVEFAVGPKMDTSKGGTAYKYTRDFNVTICADGQDLSSGYSFLYGGWDNKETAITRGNTVVARCDSVIPRSSGIHRRWFYLKAEKRGNTLNFFVDGVRVLTYKDPDPLPGNRVGIWTWGNGIMVSRVRISARALGGTEPPGAAYAPCRTLYTP